MRRKISMLSRWGGDRGDPGIPGKWGNKGQELWKRADCVFAGAWFQRTWKPSLEFTSVTTGQRFLMAVESAVLFFWTSFKHPLLHSVQVHLSPDSTIFCGPQKQAGFGRGWLPWHITLSSGLSRACQNSLLLFRRKCNRLKGNRSSWLLKTAPLRNTHHTPWAYYFTQLKAIFLHRQIQDKTGFCEKLWRQADGLQGSGVPSLFGVLRG